MKEKNVDLSHHRSKALFTIPIDRPTHFITVCNQAKEVGRPTIPGISYCHWTIANPANYHDSLKEGYIIFRVARDQIDDRVQSLSLTLV